MECSGAILYGEGIDIVLTWYFELEHESLEYHHKTRLRIDPSFVFVCAPGGTRFQRVKVPNLSGSSGKDIAYGKGVVGDGKSEGNWMANIWSDEQKSHIRLYVGGRLHSKLYTVNVADRWREKNVWYPGRSVRYAPKGVTTTRG